jgi:glycosyltransferase involved in cell wall biosynthesis
LYRPWIKSLKHFLLAYGSNYQIVVIFRPETYSERISLIRHVCPHSKVIYYPHDLHFLRFKREAIASQKNKYFNLANRYKPIELSNSLSADVTILLSPEEKSILSGLIPEAQVNVLPFVIAPSDSLNKQSRDQNTGLNLVFIGNFQHSPNQDAVLYFAEQILPLIKKVHPSVLFHVVGANPTPDILALNSLDTVIHGYIEMLDEFLVNMHISVLPLRFGAGVKGKLGISMRAGLAIVSTPLGVEGVDIKNNHNGIVASDSIEFAEAVIKLIEDPDLRISMGQTGLEFITKAWSLEKARLEIVKILNYLELGVGSQHGEQFIPLYPFGRSSWPGFYSLKENPKPVT